MTLYADVVLPLPLDQSFSYIVPESAQKNVKIGSRVLVPLGQRLLTGFIVNLRKRKLSQVLKLKEIAEVLDESPVFSLSFLSFARKLSSYYYSSWGELLQASLPPSFILKSQKRVSLSTKGKTLLRGDELSGEEKELLGYLKKREYTALYLKRKLKVKNLSLLLSRLEKKGLIHIQEDIEKIRQKTAPKTPVGETQLEMDFSLDARSLEVAGQITRKIGDQVFLPFYLFGPSEKRESVYFYLIKRILADGRKVLYLVPEITLTQSLTEKFEKRLGEKVALLHSRLSEKKRELEWRKIKNGEVDVVVGPRSALFSPLENLGLIIVDEEQDESYYQRENPCYDARKGARFRAKQEEAVLVYGSARPSVSAFFWAKKRGNLLSLESEPRRRNVKIVDDRKEKGVISWKLEEKIAARLNKREPVILFLNRRGYASSLFCSRCNTIPRCSRCDIALSYHKKEEKLVCHYCGYSLPKMDNCPECGSRMIRERGIGIEALEEKLKTLFPQSCVTSFATDLTRLEQERVLHNFRRGKIDILVGTQLLAHQVDVPPVFLVGILFPETILTLSDYRAGQKTFLTLSQMMKFLKDDERAEVLIQTTLPQHFTIRQAAFEDYISFYKQELRLRRLMNYPPFSHIVEVLFQGENLRSVARKSREFSEQVKNEAGDIEILGPALASVSRVRGVSRVQVVLKAKRKKTIDDVLVKVLKTVKLRKSILVYD
ncbi:MAG: primosomal protein N' [Candidatus Aminicenantes bacterium]|nr:primosomal protein N' [Candidatus Aminicenantes bacterium]MBL7082977.1 primosomal protein N' [Candidatus Aminicenantes bacterium]